MFLMTDTVAAFVFSVKKEKKKKRKKPNKVGALKGISGLPGQHPHPKYYLNHFE